MAQQTEGIEKVQYVAILVIILSFNSIDGKKPSLPLIVKTHIYADSQKAAMRACHDYGQHKIKLFGGAYTCD